MFRGCPSPKCKFKGGAEAGGIASAPGPIGAFQGHIPYKSPPSASRKLSIFNEGKCALDNVEICNGVCRAQSAHSVVITGWDDDVRSAMRQADLN